MRMTLKKHNQTNHGLNPLMLPSRGSSAADPRDHGQGQNPVGRDPRYGSADIQAMVETHRGFMAPP